MIIEIRRVQFVNKGAELMLLAILDRMRSALDDAEFTVAPDLGLRPYDKLVPLGIRPKAWLWRHRVQWGYLADRLPDRLLEMYGIVSDSQVDVVLDASGFAYGDQWGPKKTVRMARATRRWRRQGTKLVLLPQAFGPFTRVGIRDPFKTIVENADRVYARDFDSLAHIRECSGTSSRVRYCPDFTVLIPGQVPAWFSSADCDVAIIPNEKMVEKASSCASATYLPFLVSCVRSFTNAEYRPFFLIHGGPRDEQLARRANEMYGREIPIIVADDPIQIKGIIGACKTVVSSRYHGLVSALSQGVPAVGMGWSHKYATLFDYYGCHKMLLSPSSYEDGIESAISRITCHREEIVEALRARAKHHAIAVRRMWDDVLNVITDER